MQSKIKYTFMAMGASYNNTAIDDMGWYCWGAYRSGQALNKTCSVMVNCTKEYG